MIKENEQPTPNEHDEPQHLHGKSTGYTQCVLTSTAILRKSTP
jgi:hypothetical protein